MAAIEVKTQDELDEMRQAHPTERIDLVRADGGRTVYIPGRPPVYLPRGEHMKPRYVTAG